MLLIWRRWRGWRHGRPFWGGLFTVVAGVEIGVLPLAPMKVMLHQGTAGVPTVVLAAIMAVLGLSGWFTPQYRGLAGIITVILASAALVLSNLGGFMIGTLLGVVGGALMFAWRPVPAEEAGDQEAAAGAGANGSEEVADDSGEATDKAFAPTAAKASGAATVTTTTFHSDAPPAPVASGESGASGRSGSGSGAGGVPGPRTRSAESPTSASGDSSLAAAFGVEEDDPFPSPRGDTPPGSGRD